MDLKQLEFNKKAVIITGVIIGVLLLAWVSYGIYYEINKVENNSTNTANTNQASSTLPVTSTNPVASINNNTDTSNQTAVASDWQTYKNDKYGYQIKYPKDWTVAIAKSDGVIGLRAPETKPRPEDFAADVYLNFEDSSIQKIINATGSQFSDRKVLREDIIIDNSVSAVKLTVSTPSYPEWISHSLLVEIDSGVLNINDGARNKNIERFWLIVSTFKFADSTSDWQTYKNKDLGFEVKFPQTYNFQTVKDGVFTIKSPTREGLYDVNIQVNQDPSFNNLSLDAIIQNKVKSHSIIEQQKTTLADQVAYEGVSTGIVNEYTLISKKGNNLYELLFNTGNKDSLAANKTALDVNQKLILSTFKFTN